MGDQCVRNSTIKRHSKAQQHTLVFEMQEILKGWEGQPKGMLQVLCECGFIDGSKSEKYYTIEGRKDEFGYVGPTTSCKMMMEQQIDFIEEETLLQYHGRQLGVTIDRTPKCHPEMAGEGIEGLCKGVRWLPITEKRTKNKFCESVKKSISQDIMTIERQQIFSRQAWQYMLAYQAIDNNEDESNEPKTAANGREPAANEDKKTTFALIKNVIKTTNLPIRPTGQSPIGTLAISTRLLVQWRWLHTCMNSNKEQGNMLINSSNRVNKGKAAAGQGAADQIWDMFFL
jgi:hypothetical protein